ncbi:Alpha/Beta hydrolase protein [Cladochytrium replicatum]|nr:Alpha/Beta hydrolase protein [Cladochytrium replicatum]
MPLSAANSFQPSALAASVALIASNARSLLREHLFKSELANSSLSPDPSLPSHDHPAVPPSHSNNNPHQSNARLRRYRPVSTLYKAPRAPVVLCHGLFGYDVIGPDKIPFLQIHYWSGVAEALRDLGCTVYIPAVPSVGSIPNRAAHLHRWLERNVSGDVNLIGHSMGGLDCRYVVSRLGSTKYTVKSLTTIATPHRGSAFMDWCRDELGLGCRGDRELLHDFPFSLPVHHNHPQTEDNHPPHRTMHRRPYALRKYLGPIHPVVRNVLATTIDRPAFACLTSSYLTTYFNPSTPDHADVAYFSYAAETPTTPRSSPALVLPYQIITEQEGPNDGMVSVRSATWGELLGIMEADHWELVPPKVWRRLWSLNVSAVAGKLRQRAPSQGKGERERFDYVDFYLHVVTGLADRGF